MSAAFVSGSVLGLGLGAGASFAGAGSGLSIGYDLDRFRRFPGRAAIQMATQQEALPDKDEELLLLAIDWLVRDFFGP